MQKFYGTLPALKQVARLCGSLTCQAMSQKLSVVCLLFLSFNISIANAQDIQVQGKVTDRQGPLPGVAIKVQGNAGGGTTDANGLYKINAPANGILVVSSIGYKTQTISINNRTTIDVTLETDQKALEDVVVVGYGTQKKVNVTGAVATVSGAELVKRPVVNPAAMLQGTMPGVQVTQSTGEPGNENVSIRVRGTGTFSGSTNEPLVLIDGVPGRLQDVNANDIDNVSVLKDAASSAIYGSRAANGVVLVTTKQGKAGKMAVSYDGSIGIYKATKLFDLITNSAEYMELYNEARINTGLTDPALLYPQDQIDLYRNSTDRVRYPNTDWLSLIFRTAPTQNHNLTFRGGNEKTTYNVSLGYINQIGIMRGFDYKRYNARINLTSQINDHIKFGTNLLLKSGTTVSTPFGSTDMFLSAMSQAPTYGPYLADGSGRLSYKAYDLEYNNKNPFGVLNNNISHNTNDYALNAQGWVEVSFTKDFSWYTKGAVNATFDKYKDFRTQVPEYNFRTNQLATMLDLGSGLTVQDQQTIYTNLFSYLNYNHNFNGHSVKAQAGYSIEQNHYQYLQGYRKEFPVLDLRELNAGSPSLQNAYGTGNQWALMSFFGRVNYNYKERYLLEANLRYDGSSRFSDGNKWGAFPSFSAGWRLSEESFFKNLKLSWVDNLKLRGSWGQVGNQNISFNGYEQYYPYQALLSLTGNYSFDNNSLTTGVVQQALNNPLIRWETTTMSDIGLDLTLFHNFNLTADWYNRKTSDIIRPSQVTAIVGLTPPFINNGTVANKGVELGLSYSNRVKGGWLEGLDYRIGVNADHNSNKLVEFGQQEIGSYTINRNGQPINSYYMLEVAGIFQSAAEVAGSPKQYNDNTLPGDLKYRDANGDGKINDDDRTLISGAYPKLNYSFNLSASYKGFDVSALLQGVYGVKYFVNNWGTIPFVQGAPPTTDWRDRWTPQNPSATMPRIYWGWNAPQKLSRASTYFLQDGSYMRLKNVVLGYTIPKTLLKKFGVENVRVYFSGDNLLTATKYRGLDPERGGSGDFLQYPQNKIYAFGLNVTF